MKTSTLLLLSAPLSYPPTNFLKGRIKYCVTYFFLLQILSPVLDMIPYSFGIRLAALASHKEFIDLGKWLSTNLRTYKDNFCEVASVKLSLVFMSSGFCIFSLQNRNYLAETFLATFRNALSS